MKQDYDIIIRSQYIMKPFDLMKLQRSIVEQRDSGVIVLPTGCDLILVPKDTEIKVEAKTN